MDNNDNPESDKSNHKEHEDLGIDSDSSEDGVFETAKHVISVINVDEGKISVRKIQADANWSQECDKSLLNSSNIQDTSTLYPRPQPGKAHRVGTVANTKVFFNNKGVTLCLETGEAYSIVCRTVLDEVVPDWESKALPLTGNTLFSGVGSRLNSIGVMGLEIVFLNQEGSVRIKAEFLIIDEDA